MFLANSHESLVRLFIRRMILNVRILMHANSITERGTTSALLDYAEGLRVFGISPVISWENNYITNNPNFVRLIPENFQTTPYLDFDEIKQKSSMFDAAYFIKGGEMMARFLILRKI
jgi:hypothetical protein